MLFKDAHIGNQIFLFDRTSLELFQGTITNVVSSHIDTKAPFSKMVVDVSANIDGKPQTFTIDDTLSIAYFGNTAISCERDSILHEVETLKYNSENIVKDIDKHKEIIHKCETLLSIYNPAIKERKENEERFSKLEDKIDRLASLMESIAKE